MIMNNVVHRCDCMDLMKDKPDKFYDLAIVDPPYNVGASDGNFGRGPKSYRKDLTHYKNYNKTPDKKYFNELFRISENQIIWGMNYYPEFLYKSGAIVWFKKNYGPLSDCEIAFQSFNKLVKSYIYRWSGAIKGNGKLKFCDKKIIHPNQKPVALAKWCLKNYAKPGWKILDTHVGSGYMRIACNDMGFWFEGCEIDKDYWQAQEERFQNHIAQPEIFDKQEIQENIFQEQKIDL